MVMPAASTLSAIMLIGLSLTWWARVHLGRLWSGVITRKESHRLIQTGPYALVRHPIYVGLVIALSGRWARLTLECFNCLTKSWKYKCAMIRPINANLTKPIEEFGSSASNDQGDPALSQCLMQIAKGI